MVRLSLLKSGELKHIITGVFFSRQFTLVLLWDWGVDDSNHVEWIIALLAFIRCYVDPPRIKIIQHPLEYIQ